VQNIVSLPIDRQVDSLKMFINTYPHFEKAYRRLLENYIMRSQLPDADEYFRELAKQPPHKQNSYWMLAKIADYREKPETAFAFLQEMIRAGNLSLEKLDYLIEFDHRNPGKFETREFLSKVNLDLHQREIIDILFDYYQQNYELVIRKFHLLPESIAHEPLLMHLWGRCGCPGNWRYPGRIASIYNPGSYRSYEC
jgi:tetratricopeptide (TPR) repeat protein